MYVNDYTFLPLLSLIIVHTPPSLSLSPGACGQNSSPACHTATQGGISPHPPSSATTSVSRQISDALVVAPLLSPSRPPSDHDSSPPKPKKLRMCTPSGSSLDMPDMESEVHVW